MLVSTTTTVFALAAICAARPNANVLKARQQDMIGPSAAFQIYAANPDQSNSLGGAAASSSLTTESITSMEMESSSSTESSSTESSSSSSSSSISLNSSISIFSSLPSLTGGLPLPTGFSALNASLASGGAASSTGFMVGNMRALEAKQIRDINDIVKDGITRVEARQMGAASTSMPSLTSASSVSSSLLSLSSATVTNSSTTSAASPSVTNQAGIAFEFRVSQDAGGGNGVDLVVSFANLPCGKSPGPFSFEFNFVPNAGYSSTGEGQINVFKVNGNLGNRPTYNSVDAATGSLIGTFELPTGSDANQPKLIFINQLVCEPTINLRFGISQYSSSAGAVAYFNQNGMGLRERSG